jgi:hypothetical protein
MPIGTPVDRCYKELLAKNYSKASAARICQHSTGESLRTGKPAKASNCLDIALDQGEPLIKPIPKTPHYDSNMDRELAQYRAKDPMSEFKPYKPLNSRGVGMADPFSFDFDSPEVQQDIDYTPKHKPQLDVPYQPQARQGTVPIRGFLGTLRPGVNHVRIAYTQHYDTNNKKLKKGAEKLFPKGIRADSQGVFYAGIPDPPPSWAVKDQELPGLIHHPAKGSYLFLRPYTTPEGKQEKEFTRYTDLATGEELDPAQVATVLARKPSDTPDKYRNIPVADVYSAKGSDKQWHDFAEYRHQPYEEIMNSLKQQGSGMANTNDDSVGEQADNVGSEYPYQEGDPDYFTRPSSQRVTKKAQEQLVNPEDESPGQKVLRELREQKVERQRMERARQPMPQY